MRPDSIFCSFYFLRGVYSGSLNDGKAAIPLLKGIEERLPLSNLMSHTMDAGYDFEAIYEQVYRMGHLSVIAYNKRNEPELIGFDCNFAPTCLREHSYRYDSYDAKYETLKYTTTQRVCGMSSRERGRLPKGCT